MDKNRVSRRVFATSMLGLGMNALATAASSRPKRGRDVEQVLSTLQTTSMLVLSKGKRGFEYGNVQETSYVASARKSLTSMLYGPSVEGGKIHLDWSLADIGFDDIGGLLPVEAPGNGQ